MEIQVCQTFNIAINPSFFKLLFIQLNGDLEVNNWDGDECNAYAGMKAKFVFFFLLLIEIRFDDSNTGTESTIFPPLTPLGEGK